MEKEELKQEAIKRLELLNLHPNVLKDFKAGTINYSEYMSSQLQGILYWLDNNPEFVKIKDNFESKYGGLVYHAILTPTIFGSCLTLLYVSKEKSDWKSDMKDLKKGEACAYVYNLDDPYLSELGYVGFKEINGGLTRTY